MREIKFRGKRLDNNTQTGPADGWVTGFYYQGLCEGEVRHFIASFPLRMGGRSRYRRTVHGSERQER